MASGAFRLPVSRKGNFFDDSFFQDFQKDFDVALKDVLGKWSGRSLLADRFTARRRKDFPGQETCSSEASVFDTAESYVIVLDMKDFVSGDITVQTQGFAAVVEAECGGKQFQRKYPVPISVNMDALVAAMSDDGILTITGPKKMNASKTSTPSSQKEHQKSLPTFVSSVKFDVGLPKDTPSLSSSSQGKPQERIIPLVLEVEEEDIQIPAERILPISRRGRFFKDDYFEKIWKEFESAVDEMKSQKGDTIIQDESSKSHCQTPETNVASQAEHRKFSRLNSYRNLRDWSKMDDNQAATVTESNKEYKIVLDVKDLLDGHLDVKASEGYVDVTVSYQGSTFQRRFALAGLIRPMDVTAAVSDDGILTILAPK